MSAPTTSTEHRPRRDAAVADAVVDRVVDTLLATDAYKLDHRRQYPPGTEVVFSNLTARGSRVPGVDVTVFFGLQAFLTRLTQRWDEFFGLDDATLDQALAKYDSVVTALLGTGDVGTDHFRVLHEIGYLPLRVKAFREGALVPLRVPYFTIENTDPRVCWLTNYLETELCAELWQPITSATIAWRNRVLLDERAEKSGDPAAVDYQGHDFSCRGMAGMQAAAASGAGHLLSFRGTDTLPAVRFIERYYPGDNGIVAASCAATEHSVMCAGGRDTELETFRRLLALYPAGILSIVSDTWDLWRVCTDFLPRLKDTILAREGKLVIRPDSGDPELILCGDPDAPPGSPARRGVVGLLADEFGTVLNDKGYRDLDPHVGAIYGDSITYERADAITANLMRQGFASTAVVFGYGSYTYQYQTRDTFKMAMKATWVQINGQGYDILKDPVTDDGTKKSATGRLAVRRMMDSRPYLIEHADADQEANQELRLVYEDGKLLRQSSFADVRDELRRETGLYLRRTKRSMSAKEV
ncbi:nicotinate phosphoribosyltransferase [Mycobacterium avium subsp. hominissuis]|uniref:Nicotinamide phosphoribosyltransferase n=1 Tax=Mycobacterium avium subsp. hominissuis TaxID=439334 RepID=A0A2A3L4Y5_MYCAV|nr:nicotinate phosphoribosyltransferase [Mycobacterium avium]MBZ4632856.1 nicotinate phosphoribosyltransferase [Mycobacterium avium subsp. hominissuis]PBJ31918.1 nicotinate phosphoribosyltransferase [Mycobacterium avium subsp. hominissuis]